MNGTRRGILHASFITPELGGTVAAYVSQLGFQPAGEGVLDAGDAALLGLAGLAGAPLAWLANCEGVPVLRLIASPAATVAEPMHRQGWLSLEVLVGDVDELVAGLKAPFRVLGGPANLDLSDDIRAAQVLGPAGEMLYLTEVKAPVPPFDLPMTTSRVAVPFIAVQTTPDRAASQRAWSTLLGADGWAFDTKITVLSRAHQRPLDTRYPVAVVPMPGQCLVEIDELALPARTPSGNAAGFHSLCLGLADVDAAALGAAGWQVHHHDSALALIGPAGEHVEVRSVTGS